MNKEDVTRWAREAGIPTSEVVIKDNGTCLRAVDVERFATLVVAAERKAMLETIDALYNSQDPNPMYQEGYNHALYNLEEYVKARGRK